MLRYKLFLSILFLLNGIHAQTGVNSPYSAFSLGEFNNGMQAAYMGMGNARVAMADSNLLNISNPASYSFIALNQPIFNIDINVGFVDATTSSEQQKFRTSAVNNLTFGIPLAKKWGLAFGLNPFSQVGYSLVNEQAFLENDTVKHKYQGSGGANRVFFGLAFAPLMSSQQSLSIGFNASYLFGTTDRERTVIFPVGTDYFNAKVTNSLRFRDFFFDVGAIYSLKISPNHKLSLSAVLSPQRKITSFNDVLAYNFRYLSGSQVIEEVFDTVQFVDTLKGSIILPQRIAVGFSHEIKPNQSKLTSLNKSSKFYRILLNGELEIQEWSKYRENFNDFSQDFNLNNSLRTSFGVQITPNDGSAGKKPTQSYFSFMNYRLGARYLSTKLNLNNTQINDIGISFGLGFPVSYNNSGTSVNIGAELGRRGTTENSLIQEDYLNFYFGISLMPDRHSKWFVKRKYD